MPLMKCQTKGAGTPFERRGGHTGSAATSNGLCINLSSANLNGNRILFDKNVKIPTSKCEESFVNRTPVSSERNLSSRRRAVSLNRECDKKRNLMRPPSAGSLPKFNTECFRNVASSKSEGAPSVHNFKHNVQKTGTAARQHPQENEPRKGCTINLQPGHYKVNIEWRSASKPFLITFIPSKDKGEGVGTPPKEPEPLLYGESSQPPSIVSSISLPRRIVHKLIRSPHSSGSSNVHIVQRTPGIKKLPDQSRQNHRKGKHRWASLSCVHMGSLDDSLSEQSGCDSFEGYEGVEHLKRGSVSTAHFDGDNNSQSNKIVDYNINNMASSQFNYSRSCSDSLNRSSVLNTELKNEYFPGRSNLPLYTVSCEAIINSHMNNSVPCEGIKERRTWHEDESFLKQVVDEYFNDSVNECNISVPLLKDSEMKKKDSLQIKKGIVKSTSDCYLSQRSKPITANIIPLQASSKMSSSCIITKTCSLLETVNEISDDGKRNIEDNLNFAENLLGETDETTSWHSDNSSGYEADTEPSDKEVYGMFFWREWMSAPDVSAKNHKLPTNEGCVDYSSCEDRKFSLHQETDRKPLLLHQYGPRKSSSTGDAQKLSQSFVGVEKFRAHKLRRFIDDLCNESKVSSIRKIKRIDENEDCSFSNDGGEALNFSNYPVSSLQPGVDCPNFNLEFVNKNYLGKNHLDVFPAGYCVQRKSDTSLDDRLSIDLTEKALSEGLVITQSRNLKVDQPNLISSPHLLGNNFPSKFKHNSGTSFRNNSNYVFENKSLLNEKIESAAVKSCNGDHSCLRESWDSISKINRHKNGCNWKCSDDNYHVYYNVRSFCSNNRNMKNISKKRLSKHLNGDIWQSEEILSCCMSPDKPSSLQHFQGGSENMACSPSIEQSSQSYRSDFNLTQPFVSSVGRVLERGTKQEKSAAAKETTQRSELHVPPPVSLFESVNKEQSMPLSGKPSSPLQQVPNPHRQYKVSKYIMGNIQPGKENNSSLTEDSDSNVEVDKSAKRKSSSKVKPKKSFNTFLGSFGAAGALAKNISNSADKKKANIFVSSNVSENCKDSPYNLTANKIKCDTYVDKTQCSSSAISSSHGHLTRELWTPANERANYSPVRRKVRKEFKNTCEYSDGVATNVLNNVSKGDQNSICDNENQNEGTDQPIYENITFHKQRYVGKFSYINSLIPNSDTEEKSVINPTESDILSDRSIISSNSQSSPSVTSHVDSFIPCASDYSVQNRKSNATASDQTNFSAPKDNSDQFVKLDSMDLNEIYEDFLSAKDSPRSSVAMPFKFEDDDVSDDTEEGVSDEENSVTKGSSLCHSASAGSVVSDASSFYYTAGGATLNDAFEAVTEYFSVAEKADSKENETLNSDSLPEKSLEVEGVRSKESELIFSKLKCDQEEKGTLCSEHSCDRSDSSVHSESHDYENANILVADDKIFITLKSSDYENTNNLDASKKETQKLIRIGNETRHEKGSKLDNEIHSENLFNSKLQSKINPNYKSYNKLRNRTSVKNRPTVNISSENTNKSEVNISCENAETLKNFVCSEDDINSKDSLKIEEELESRISDNSFSESYANGVVRAFPCVVISEDDTKIDLKSRNESFDTEENITTLQEDTEDLLESYYSQLARDKGGSGSESSFCVGTKLEEEILTTEPEISSNYAQTTFSEATNETFNENLSSSGNSESRHTMEEFRASPFSSSEGISDHSGSEPSNDFGSSLSCEGICDQPPRKNIFRVPLSGPTFPRRRHTFQFAPTSDQNKSAFYAQRLSNPDLPPVLGSWNLSPTSPMDAKKPPRSPSHRGRDSSSVPREGRSSIQMRRRCRSVSSGSSGEGSSKEVAISSQHRPASLISISTSHATSSQESLHDFPLGFSPAAGDRAPNIRW